jgi:hypothetical protein
VALFAAGPTSVTVTDVLTGLGSVAGALILAWLALYWRRLPLLRGYRPAALFAEAARRFQSGVVNDYVTWIVIGLTCLGALFAAIIVLPCYPRRSRLTQPCASGMWRTPSFRATGSGPAASASGAAPPSPHSGL